MKKKCIIVIASAAVLLASAGIIYAACKHSSSLSACLKQCERDHPEKDWREACYKLCWEDCK